MMIEGLGVELQRIMTAFNNRQHNQLFMTKGFWSVEDQKTCNLSKNQLPDWTVKVCQG